MAKTKKQLRAKRDKELAQNEALARGAWRSIQNKRDLRSLQRKKRHQKERAEHLAKYRSKKKKILDKWNARIAKA